MTGRILLHFFILALPWAPAVSADHVWIVGGGPTLFNSQAQIEQNVKWEREVILRQVPTAQVRVFFGSGSSLEKDVVEWHHPDESAESLQPLSRVFGASYQNGERYYKNTVPGVAGSTKADELMERLRQDFARVKEDDKALFIFYGHGSRNALDSSGNALRLWGDTRQTANDLSKLLSKINPETPVRVFLPQCFSGGFARPIQLEAVGSQNSKARNMCGFMAVADDRQSEGCSSSVNVGDYRDYTSYFFAALDGRTRLGAPLPSNPDLNADQVVTLREAHFYSLVNGESTDVPRTTSEVFLVSWDPWYLRWVTAEPQTGNIYRKLLATLANKNALPLEDGKLAPEARRNLELVKSETAMLKKEQANLDKETMALQARIRSDVVARWPETSSPYTKKFWAFMQHDVNDAQQFIMQHADYAKLVQYQERYMALDVRILASRRKQAQFERILWLHKLALRLEKFERFASPDSRAAYLKLVACEESSL